MVGAVIGSRLPTHFTIILSFDSRPAQQQKKTQTYALEQKSEGPMDSVLSAELIKCIHYYASQPSNESKVSILQTRKHRVFTSRILITAKSVV